MPTEQLLVITAFAPPIFTSYQKTNEEVGLAKANISIDENGRVVSAEVLETNPKNLDKKPIKRAILKAIFSTGSVQKNYVHIFEFDIVQTVNKASNPTP